MRYITLLLFSFVLLVNCNNENDVLCSCIAQEFAIALVDKEGNDLIANETYDVDKILITKKGFDLNPNYDEVSRSLNFELFGESGDNRYEIVFTTNLERDILILNLIQEGDPSCCPSYNINSALYNGMVTEVIRGDDTSPFEGKIIIVK